jgi:hypothetical protein
MVPMVQVKLLGQLLLEQYLYQPLQIFAVAALVTDGFGLTVTVTGLILKHPALVVPLM